MPRDVRAYLSDVIDSCNAIASPPVRPTAARTEAAEGTGPTRVPPSGECPYRLRL